MSVSVAQLSKFQFNWNDAPIVGGLLFTYAAGTTTKLTTYQDSFGAVPNTNPIVLDANGQCNLYLTDGLSYKFVLSPPGDTDPPTNPYWTQDNILSAAGAAGGVSVSIVPEGPFESGTDFTPGTTTTLTLSQAYGHPVNVTVHFDGIYQAYDQYSISGDQIIFNSPIPVGTNTVYIVGGLVIGLGYITPDQLASEISPTGASLVGFLQAGTGAVGRTLQSKNSDIIHVKDFGAKGDGVTDDTAAFNLAAAYIKSSMQNISGAEANSYPVILDIGNSVYLLNGSVNLQNIVGLGWGIRGHGAVIHSTYTGRTCLDALGSAYGYFGGFTIIGDGSSSPAIGIQIGRIVTSQQPAGSHYFDHVKMDGMFTRAGLFNAAGEGNLWEQLVIHNMYTGTGAYAFMIDGLHHYTPITDFQQTTWSNDSPDSCIQHKIVNCDLSNANGPACFFSNANQIEVDGYMVGVGPAVDFLYGNVGASELHNHRWMMHCEASPGLTNNISYRGLASGTAIVVDGFYLSESAGQASSSLVDGGANTTIVDLKYGDILGVQLTCALVSGTATIDLPTMIVNGVPQNNQVLTNLLAADIELTTANTQYAGPSVNPLLLVPSGVYLLTANVTLNCPSAAAAFVVYMNMGSTSLAAGAGNTPAANTGCTITLTAVVTNPNNPITIYAESSVANSAMKFNLSGASVDSQISYVKLI